MVLNSHYLIQRLRKLKEKLVPDPAHSSVGKWLLGGFGGDEKVNLT